VSPATHDSYDRLYGPYRLGRSGLEREIGRAQLRAPARPPADVLVDLRAARDRLADADRRVLVSRERCRLTRVAVALAAGSTDP
jgi:hypothetical protein